MCSLKMLQCERGRCWHSKLILTGDDPDSWWLAIATDINHQLKKVADDLPIKDLLKLTNSGNDIWINPTVDREAFNKSNPGDKWVVGASLSPTQIRAFQVGPFRSPVVITPISLRAKTLFLDIDRVAYLLARLDYTATGLSVYNWSENRPPHIWMRMKELEKKGIHKNTSQFRSEFSSLFPGFVRCRFHFFGTNHPYRVSADPVLFANRHDHFAHDLYLSRHPQLLLSRNRPDLSPRAHPPDSKSCIENLDYHQRPTE